MTNQVEKLFDVACTLIDVMACVPLSPTSYDMGPRDYLNRFVALISSLRGTQSRYLPLLQNKIAEVLPSYQLPSHPRLDIYGNPSQSSTPNAAEGSAYDSSSSLSLRHGIGGMHYQDSIGSLPSHVGGPGNYTPFSSAMQYQDATTAAGLASSGLYQTHLPRSGGFSG
jgi:hypothetical protein